MYNRIHKDYLGIFILIWNFFYLVLYSIKLAYFSFEDLINIPKIKYRERGPRRQRWLANCNKRQSLELSERYVVTITTTVGYGNITAKSNIGKIFTIFYALIGIPLFIMCLTNTGDLLAEILITCYGKTVKFIAKLLCKSKLKMPYSASKFQENKQEMVLHLVFPN